MDSATRHLLHALYANPRDPDALAEVRRYFVKQGQLPALAKVLEWWSSKASSAQEAAQALFDAAQLLQSANGDASQIISVLEKALEYDPCFDSASIKLEALYRARGEEEKAAQLHKRRNDRISLIEALDGILSQENRPSSRRPPASARRNREAAFDTRSSANADPGNSGSRSGASEPAGVVSYSYRKTKDLATAELDARRERDLQIPSAPRVPDFAIASAGPRSRELDRDDDVEIDNAGFDERPTSSKRALRGGLAYAAEVGTALGNEVAAQNVAHSRQAPPISALVSHDLVQPFDADDSQPTYEDGDDEEEDRFYRSYSGRAPDTGEAAGFEYDFDGRVTEETRGLIRQPEAGFPDDHSARWDESSSFEPYQEQETAETNRQAAIAYRIIAGDPLNNPAEIDSEQPAVEIDVLWGDANVIHVAHLSPPRAYWVGDATTRRGRRETDFLIGRETLGTDKLPILVESDSGLAVVIPTGAVGELIIEEKAYSFEDLHDNGLLQPCRELIGARQLRLVKDSTVWVSHRGFTFIVRMGVGAKTVGKNRGHLVRFTEHGWNLAVAGVACLMLLCFAFLPPETELLSLNAMNSDSRLATHLIEPPAIEEEEIPEWLQEQKKDAKKAKESEQDKAKRKPDERTKNGGRRQSYASPSNGERASRLLSTLASSGSGGGQTLQKVVAKLGSVGAGGSSTAAFSLSSALAGLNGVGGVNLGGIGTGTGIGIGMGSAGGEAAAAGVGKLSGRGGGGRGRVRGKVRALSLGSRVTGSLTPGQVLEVINRSMAKIQQCYERGLTRNPALAGQVKFEWTVTPSGDVSSLRQAGSTLGDIEVTKCIAGTINRMRFPKPKGGSVSITFPFIFRRAQ